MVIAGHSLRPIAVSSVTAIPKAPSPAKPTTGVSGQPILAPTIDGRPIAAGPEKTRRQVFPTRPRTVG